MSSAAGFEQWSKLAYQSFRDGNWEIYLSNGDGSAAANLSRHPATDARPRLNLGATRVVFNTDRDGNSEIYVVNGDGSATTRLTIDKAADFAPAWSPDSQRVVFVSDRTGNNELWMMNADGSSPLQLTFHADADSSPAWSPDGQWIAAKRTSGGLSTIYLIRPDGSGLAPLVSGLRYMGDINWSPTSDRLITDADIDGDYWNELVGVRNLAGRWEAYPLLDANQPYVDLWAGAYAPDGGSVAYSRIQYRVEGRNLVLQTAQLLRTFLGSGDTAVLAGSGIDMLPSWMNADLLAPVSRVTPLPQFVHAGHVPLHLEGADRGPSGISTFDVQYALAPAGPWTDLATNLASATAYLPAIEPGSTVWLRSRARDAAGNVEDWPPAADASTTVYRWDVWGRSVDNRGLLLRQSVLNSTPSALSARNDLNGAYHLLYTTEQTHTLGMTAVGYAAAAPSALNLNADIRLDFLLPPLTELVQNGGFEDGLGSWSGDGVLVAGGLVDGAHSGNHGLLLGSGCALRCLQGPIPTGLPLAPYDSAVDNHGSLHVVQFSGSPGSDQLYYFVRSIDSGLWSEPEAIPTEPYSADNSGRALAIAVDGAGTVHVVVLGSIPGRSETGLLYFEKKPGTAWTPYQGFYYPPIWDLPSMNIQMIGDPVAGTHLLVRGRRYFFKLQAQELWQPGLDIHAGVTSGAQFNTRMAVGGDGIVHFLFELDERIVYRSLGPPEVLSVPVDLGPGGRQTRYSGEVSVVAGPHGTVHASWGLYYRYRNQQGFWTGQQPIAADAYYFPYRLQADRAGRLYVFAKGFQDPSAPMNYFDKTPDAGWSPPQPLNTSYNMWPDRMTVSDGGIVQMIYPDTGAQEVVYWSSPLGASGVISSVAQTLALPAQMTHPTLSFFHKAGSGDPHGRARLSVNIDDGLRTTTVFSTPAAVVWTQSWVDLEAWLGQTVTVTLAVEQAGAEPLLSVYLDDVSLGEWTTPVISDVTPAQIYADWAGALIIVRGENFTANSTLYLGETQLDAVTFMDDHSLHATLPATLPAGHYDVRVANTDGKQQVAPGGLTLGGWGYLPMVRK